MKRILPLLFFLTATLGFAQVGVNTTTPDPSSMLDISATNKGVLVPRVSLLNVTTTMLDGTNTAATGLLIWNTNAATVGGNGVGFYYFNGTIWVPVVQTGANDHDWYEVGTTTAPNAITDNMFHTGNIAIGKNTIDALSNPKLDIENNTSGSTVLKLRDVSTGATLHTGINLDMQSTSTATEYGIAVRHNNPNSGLKYGVYSTVENGSGNNTAFQGRVTGTGTNSGLGLIIFDSGSASTASQFAITTEMRQSTTNSTAGLRNGFTSNNLALDTGSKFGVQNIFGSIGTNVGGDLYGVYNYFESNLTSTTNKYGTYTIIPSVIGGTHYGIYSNVLKSGSFAGYFLGNVSIGTNAGNNYILPPSRGTNGQTMQTDGSGNVSWVNNAASDADWYEVGGTTPANAITDNIYTSGDVSVGKVTAATGKFDISNSTKLNTLVLDNTTASAGLKSGISNSITIQPTNNASSAISNTISGTAISKYGVSNSFANANPSGLLFEYGNGNYFASTGNSSEFGSINYFSPTANNSGQAVGLRNEIMGNNSSGTFVGVENEVNNNTNSFQIGIDNLFNGGGTGGRYGTNNNFFGNSNGEVIGTQTNIQTTGTGSKFGEKIIINSASGGVHFGLYADVTKAGSYAGYFLGNVSIGTSIGNEYILPASRGTNGQIMQTDGVGNVSWVNPTVDTDDQATDVFSLTGNTLNLSLQNDGVATQTVDLSSLAGDDDWTDVGTDIERQAGNVYIGDTSATNNNLYISNQIIDWDNIAYTIDPNGDSIMNEIQFDDGSVADPSIRFSDINTGFFSPITATTSYSANSVESFRIHPSGDIAIGQTIDPDFKLSTSSLFGNSNVRIGNNDLNDNVVEVDHSGQLGNGLEVNMNSIYTLASRSAISANSTGRVINVDLSRYETGSPSNLFGVKSIITDDITGVEYGVYSEALQANGFAGYFLGRMSIGTTTANNYILPASRGTNGQIMQTNATGVVTWVNPVIDTDTDDQATDVFSLTGTTLNLSLQNDGIATQTVNLASLNTDNQTVDVLTLTGDTLNLSLFGDGVATQTLNLATIDNQATDVFSLSGNTLNLSLQDDGVATQTLDLSPIANSHWTDVTTHIQPTIASKSVVIGDAIVAPTAKLSIKRDSAPATPQLEIVENQANDDGKIKFSNAVEILNEWSLFARADDTPASNLFNINHTIGGNIVRINGEGRVGIMRTAATNALEVGGDASKTTAGAWLANSDSRLKKNISTISPTDALNKVLSLRGVNYEWNDDKTGMKRPEGNQIGFVAQEIQEVFPEKVSEDKLGYLQTAYGDYDPIIFQAIKALNDKIEKLEKENQELKKLVKGQK